MDIECICNNFFSDNKSLSSSVLLSYQKHNNGKNINNNNNNQFKNFIMNSSEFKTHFSDVFNNAFQRVFHVDFEKHKPDMMKKFMTHYLMDNNVFTIFEVLNFLKNDILFVSYYTEKIENIYKFYYSDEMVDEQLIESLEVLKKMDFGKDDIEKKLKAHIYSFRNTKTMIDDNVDIVLEEHKEQFIESYKSKFNKSPDMESIKQFNDFMSQKNRQVELYFNSKYNDCTVFYTDIVKTFGRVFERDITVFEYVKYYSVFSNDTENSINEYHSVFIEKFKMVSNIYSMYLNEKVNVVSFIHVFLDILEIDDDLFFTKAIDIVIDYTEYLNVMFDNVKTIYKNTYNEAISDLDLQYFFEKIYEKKLNLIDDNLPNLISFLKEETDGHQFTLTNIFKNILQRDPDVKDIDTYIMFYRYSHESCIQPSVRLEDELYESLEYHDILKKIISERFDNVSKSELYKMLNTVLTCKDSLVKRDYNAIYMYLDSSI
jgi:hypothetical protein